jgi:hypothetical protein
MPTLLRHGVTARPLWNRGFWFHRHRYGGRRRRRKNPLLWVCRCATTCISAPGMHRTKRRRAACETQVAEGLVRKACYRSCGRVQATEVVYDALATAHSARGRVVVCALRKHTSPVGDIRTRPLSLWPESPGGGSVRDSAPGTRREAPEPSDPVAPPDGAPSLPSDP